MEQLHRTVFVPVLSLTHRKNVILKHLNVTPGSLH